MKEELKEDFIIVKKWMKEKSVPLYVWEAMVRLGNALDEVQ